ncbi:zincin [Backusella circina FSU 941]|nr:zincin [Backusella circina FSU 941]
MIELRGSSGGFRFRKSETEKIKYDDSLRISFTAYNQTFTLHLSPNSDLFHPNAVIHDAGGESIPLDPKMYKVYRGHVVDPKKSRKRWLKELSSNIQHDLPDSEILGWARILILDDSRSNKFGPVMEGVFEINGEHYNIKSASNYKLAKRDGDVSIDYENGMVIYKDSDATLSKRSNEPKLCGFDSLEQTRENILMKPVKQKSILKRSTLTQGCPMIRKAADCTYVRHYGNVGNARNQIISNFNMASALYEETFNISLGLINITIMDPNCPAKTDSVYPWNRPCTPNYSMEDRLSDFSYWRGKIGKDGAGLWHLMTDCSTGVEVGLAWLNQLCNHKADMQEGTDGKKQYISGAGITSITPGEWKVMAHEIGHGFGAIHDCESNNCPCIGDDCQCCQLSQDYCDSGDGFIMSSSSNSSVEYFSSCSINTICHNFPISGSCLKDLSSARLYQLNTCGNGIVEDGEECDTGGEETACCDINTCKFKNNAVCEDSNSECCRNCQIKSKGTMCRPAVTNCDAAEYCTGISAECPSDLFVADGTSCGFNNLKCASGQCTSRDYQCYAKGSSVNITKSCQTNNQECMMLCDGPGDSTKCVYVSSYFIDGTPCGYLGQCEQGNCLHGSALDASLIILGQNKKIVIPVGIRKQDDGTTTEKVTLPDNLPKSTNTLSNEIHDNNDTGKSMNNLLSAPQPQSRQDPWFLDYSSSSTLGVDSVSSSPTVINEKL